MKTHVYIKREMSGEMMKLRVTYEGNDAYGDIYYVVEYLERAKLVYDRDCLDETKAKELIGQQLVYMNQAIEDYQEKIDNIKYDIEMMGIEL